MRPPLSALSRVALRLAESEAFAVVVPPDAGGDGQAASFGFSTFNGTTWHYRGGNAQGYYCQSWLLPEKGAAIVVMTNRHLAWKLANEIRDALMPRLP